MCKAGREVPEQGVVTNTLVIEEDWGEIWRGEHETLGAVIFIAYTTPKGMELFQEALPWLRRWEDSGSSVKGHLLPILKISDSTAIPYILVKDPGGPVLPDVIASKGDEIPADALIRAGLEWVEGAVTASTLNLAPIGITPHTLFRSSGGTESGWCIAPVAPRCKRQTGLLGRGRYVAPEIAAAPDPSLTNGDCYAVAWILAEILADDWNLSHLPADFEGTVEVPKLAEAVKVGMVSNRGMFVDPNHYDLALRRWIRNDSDKDTKKYAAFRKKMAKKKEKEGRPSKTSKVPADAMLPAAGAVPPGAPVPAGVIAPPPGDIAPPPIAPEKKTAKAKKSGGGGEAMQTVMKVLAFLIVGTISAVGAYFVAMKFM